jgi:hypothetical protein
VAIEKLYSVNDKWVLARGFNRARQLDVIPTTTLLLLLSVIDAKANCL